MLSGPSRLVVRIWPEPKTPLPKFSYHEILSSKYEVDKISWSPSLSKSADWTVYPHCILVEISCWGPNTPLPKFSYQAILSSVGGFVKTLEAERISISPSPSKSEVCTSCAPLAMVVTMFSILKFPPPKFSYQDILLSFIEADNTSKSPSLSKSEAYTSIGLSWVVEIICWGPKIPLPKFSCQEILLLGNKYEAERTSMSPSPSKSIA